MQDRSANSLPMPALDACCWSARVDGGRWPLPPFTVRPSCALSSAFVAIFKALGAAPPQWLDQQSCERLAEVHDTMASDKA